MSERGRAADAGERMHAWLVLALVISSDLS